MKTVKITAVELPNGSKVIAYCDHALTFVLKTVEGYMIQYSISEMMEVFDLIEEDCDLIIHQLNS